MRRVRNHDPADDTLTEVQESYLIGTETLRHHWRALPLWLKLALCFLLVQAGYWALNASLNRSAPIDIDYMIQSYEIVLIDDASLDAEPVSELGTVDSFWVETLDAPFLLRATSTFMLEEVPDRDLGFATTVTADNYHVYINDFPVFQYGTLTPRATYHAQLREISRVSKAILKPGENRVTIIAASNLIDRIGLGTSIFGEFDALTEATQLRRFFFNDYRKITLVLAVALVLIAVALLPMSRNRLFFGALIIIALSLAVRSAFFFAYSGFPSDTVRLIIYFAATLGLATGWLLFALAWSNVRGLAHYGGVAGLYLLTLAIITILLSIYQGRGFSLSESVTDGFMALAFGLAFLIVIIGYFRQKQSAMETSIILTLLCLGLWDSYGFIVLERDLGHQKVAAPFILIALVAAVLVRNVRIYESLGAFNAALSERLQAREAELKQQYADLAQTRVARDKAEERSRILRDIHDGFGAELTRLIAGARMGSLRMGDVEPSLHEALLDLRLMIDSLDTVGDSLAVALGSFRHRISPLIDDMGMKLDWQVRDLPLNVRLPSDDILQIIRILQEAVANIVKHSDASRITIRFSPQADGTLDFMIRDDGHNVPEADMAAGQGLDNMALRARRLGASCETACQPDGFMVSITGLDPDTLWHRAHADDIKDETPASRNAKAPI